MASTTPLILRISPELKEWLKAQAARRQCTVQQVIKDVLVEAYHARR